MITELLAPAKNLECLYSVIESGADSVYMGYPHFNARMFGKNFSKEEFKKGIEYAHKHKVKVYLTLNTLIFDNEFNEALSYVEQAVNDGVDAILVQDIGLAISIKERFPSVPIHASTQMTISNHYGINFLRNIGFSRVVLARELNCDEITAICIHEENISQKRIEIEAFIHGGLCIAYSGQCYSSSLFYNSSANKGLCKMPCWENYSLYLDNVYQYSGNLIRPKDLCGIKDITTLISNGVSCLKLQGRLRSKEYITELTKVYRQVIDDISIGNFDIINSPNLMSRLRNISPRGLTRGNLYINATKDLIMDSIPCCNFDITPEQDIQNFIGDGVKYEVPKRRYRYNNISLVLHYIDLAYNYTLLDTRISQIYIPARFFFQGDIEDIIRTICDSRNVYIYMPSLTLERSCDFFYNEVLKIPDRFEIKGFVLSNLSDLMLLKNTKNKKLDFICNYSFNITNSVFAKYLWDIGISKVTLPIDSNEKNNRSLCRKTHICFEQIIYGSLPIMQLKYCILSGQNECIGCSRDCTSVCRISLEGNNSFDVQLERNVAKTEIFNKKKYVVSQKFWCTTNLRIDVLYDKIDTINLLVGDIISNQQIDNHFCYNQTNIMDEVE